MLSHKNFGSEKPWWTFGLVISLLMTVLVLVVGATHTFSSISGFGPPPWYVAVPSLLLFVSVGLGYRKNVEPRPESSRSFFRSRTKAVLAAQIVLSVLLLSRVLIWSTSAINYDEALDIREFYLIGGYPWSAVGTSAMNHTIAKLLSVSSMSVLGISKFSARLPSVVLAFLFVVVLNVHCWRKQSAFVSLLLLAHLAANGLTVWYFHSYRGYVSVTMFSFIAYCAFESIWEKGFTRRRLAWFAPSAIAASLAHNFGALFCFFLLAAAASRRFGRAAIGSSRRVLVAGILILTVGLPAGWFLVRLSHVLIRQHKVFAVHYGLLEPTVTMFSAAGFWRVWCPKLLFLFTLVLAIHPKSKSLSIRGSLGSTFLLVCFVAINLLVFSVGPSEFHPRFLLPFLIVFVLWVGNAVEDARSGWSRGCFAAAAVVFLVAFPLIESGALRRSLAHYTNLEKFMSVVNATTGGAAVNCFTFAGGENEIELVKAVYLPKAGACAGTYLLNVYPNKLQRVD